MLIYLFGRHFYADCAFVHRDSLSILREMKNEFLVCQTKTPLGWESQIKNKTGEKRETI